MSYTEYRLDDICDVITCGVAKRPDYVESGVPFLSSLNVKENKFILKTYKFISQADHLKLTKYAKPEKGDILYTRVGSFGEAAVIDLDFEFSVFVSLTLIKPKRSLVNSRYLMWYLNSPKVREFAKNNTSGIGVQNLNVGVVREYKILLPPLATQQKIAAILDAADELRQKDKALVAKYDELTQALFLDMFGDPVTNPKGWEKVRFDELVSKECPLTYGIVQPGEEFPDGVPCVRPVDLTEQYIAVEKLKRIDPKISSKFHRTLLKGGELLLSVRGSVGVISIASENLKGSNVTRGIVPIWFERNISNKTFFYYLYNTIQIQQKIKRLAKGATLIQINLKDLRELKLIKPTIVIQNQFAERVKAIEEQKSIAQSSALKSEELFNSLLQKAFNGELV